MFLTKKFIIIINNNFQAQFGTVYYLSVVGGDVYNAYVKQIKVILSTVKKISYFFTSDEYYLSFFTVANRDYFDNFGLNNILLTKFNEFFKKN